jgi:hypothetical protein
VGEKPLTMDGLKDEIAENIGDRTLLIFPESKRLTTGARYWVQDADRQGGSGGLLCCGKSAARYFH